MKVSVKSNIEWVGKVDWELRKFHGEEYSTHEGSTYNAYMVSEKKRVLIDTVWAPFAKEFVDNLEKEYGLDSIDYIVANHGEVDHSGALPELLRRKPGIAVYCTANAVKSLQGQYHQEWNFVTVKTGDTLDLGNGKSLTFIEAPMLHWPDTMFCYLSGDNVLFSNDAFGQHYATESLFNDTVDQCELFQECIKYYANILTPFSRQVKKKIEEFAALELPLDIIATSHGVIWRENPMQIVEKYLEWADNYQENQITLFYDTMWNGTRTMAENIARGIQQADPEVQVKVLNSGKADKNDLVTEVFKSKGVLVGSPTINRGYLNSVAGLMEEIRGLKFVNKKAAAFGCYGWSGEATKMLTEAMRAGGFEIIKEDLKSEWNPGEEMVAECLRYGKEFAEALR